MSALQPTPECDAAIDDSPYYQSRFVMVAADFARKLERERDSAKTLNRTLLDQLEAQATLLEAVRHERDNTWEKLEAMRDAIKEAHEALMLAPYRDQEALAKLQPFLP